MRARARSWVVIEAEGARGSDERRDDGLGRRSARSCELVPLRIVEEEQERQQSRARWRRREYTVQNQGRASSPARPVRAANTRFRISRLLTAERTKHERQGTVVGDAHHVGEIVGPEPAVQQEAGRPSRRAQWDPAPRGRARRRAIGSGLGLRPRLSGGALRCVGLGRQHDGDRAGPPVGCGGRIVRCRFDRRAAVDAVDDRVIASIAGPTAGASPGMRATIGGKSCSPRACRKCASSSRRHGASIPSTASGRSRQVRLPVLPARSNSAMVCRSVVGAFHDPRGLRDARSDVVGVRQRQDTR